MSDLLGQAIIAALGAFIVAALGYITATLQANTRTLEAAATARTVDQAAAVVGGRRSADRSPGGGGGGRAAPLYDQLRDPLPDGGLPAGRYNECGEECCSMVIHQQHGVEVSADALRAQLGGPGRAPITDGPDLVKILGHNNVAAGIHGWTAAEAPAHITASCAAGRSVIVLGRWLSPTVLHWVLVTTADATGIGYNDPWGGVRGAATWELFGQRYGGQLVTVTRPPDA